MENSKQPIVKCLCEKVVVEYFVAVTKNGEKVEIRGINKNKLKEGMVLSGVIHEDEKQDKYTDGSYARSATVEKWLQVKKISKLEKEK